MLRPLRLGRRGPAVALLCACALTVSNAVVRAAPTKPVDGAVLEDGEQKVTYSDGTVYEGEWRDGGPIHRGASRRGVPEGHGKLTFPNGDVYKGDFKNDKREGNGKVTYANGDKEVMYFKDFNSGAMIQNVVDRAKKYAIKSVLETGQPGLRIQHLLDSIVDEFAENEDLPNTTNPDDWARISGKKGERIVYIRTLVTGKSSSANRAIDTESNLGQYL